MATVQAEGSETVRTVVSRGGWGAERIGKKSARKSHSRKGVIVFGNFTQFPPKHSKAHTDNIRIILQIWKFAENVWKMLEKEARRLESNFSDGHPYLRLLWTLK